MTRLPKRKQSKLILNSRWSARHIVCSVLKCSFLMFVAERVFCFSWSRGVFFSERVGINCPSLLVSACYLSSFMRNVYCISLFAFVIAGCFYLTCWPTFGAFDDLSLVVQSF